ncbi:conserved hypothetical protein [Aspergillus terreus NIH2624]|uniref:GID complex catalytic subunit 2 n=1 Tax=Aspergillus terreus (strain NIH 2624 / FGSC A1156) TaxID=341663 RepID=Q0CRE2_ASPTN|nr:uncharacterized protein ATEG_03742 [Aspergillus terreus NIH2624]EAU35544.1 conserved hypothetical protein [Aspergillus terreus NIH2624]
MTLIEIDVVFDFVCAWCYIGKRTLDRAIGLYRKTYPGGRNDTITITWRPYYLNYNPYGHSVPKTDLMDERLKDQTPEQRAALISRMDKIGRSVGIHFKGGGMIGPNTRDAHRLVYLCREDPSTPSELQGDLVEKILEAYHELEKDISEKEMLRELAVAAGIEAATVDKWLEGNGGGKEVDDEAKRNKGVDGNTGVPRFLIQGKYRWDGDDMVRMQKDIVSDRIRTCVSAFRRPEDHFRSHLLITMELVQKEHERLSKRLKASQSIKNVQSTIDLLQSARDTIASDPTRASITLATLQNPVKSSFDAINDSLKETHSGLNKYSKALDKLFKDRPLPSTEHDALSSQEHLINRAIAMHLLREGQFSVAATFLAEMAEHKAANQQHTTGSDTTENAVSLLDIDEVPSNEVRKQFATMYYILHEMKENNNLLPAIQWSRENNEALEARGSNLEFELCRLQFVWLFHGGGQDPQAPVSAGRQAALEYARREFSVFLPRYLREIQQLMGAMAFCPNLQNSPYRAIFNNPSAWEDVAHSFTREFCSLLGLSADSPLYVAATAGAIALPTLLKLQTIMKAKRTEWTTDNELPVEIPLPPSYLFHSIFVCPVSKEQTTDENPPMMMPCGHVIAEESLKRLCKGTRFKCPYCPSESHPREARKVFL